MISLTETKTYIQLAFDYAFSKMILPCLNHKSVIPFFSGCYDTWNENQQEHIYHEWAANMNWHFVPDKMTIHLKHTFTPRIYYYYKSSLVFLLFAAASGAYWGIRSSMSWINSDFSVQPLQLVSQSSKIFFRSFTLSFFRSTVA